MKIEISKRKLESYKRAEKVARELRYQFASWHRRDDELLAKFIVYWMRVTGDIKYGRPKRPLY